MFGAAQHEDTAVSQANVFVRFLFFFVLIYSGRNIMDTELWYDKLEVIHRRSQYADQA